MLPHCELVRVWKCAGVTQKMRPAVLDGKCSETLGSRKLSVATRLLCDNRGKICTSVLAGPTIGKQAAQTGADKELTRVQN